jgi:hypothetical protein
VCSLLVKNKINKDAEEKCFALLGREMQKQQQANAFVIFL